MCETIDILDDSILEGPEEFELLLSTDDRAVTEISPSRAVVEITDNDGMASTWIPSHLSHMWLYNFVTGSWLSRHPSVASNSPVHSFVFDPATVGTLLLFQDHTLQPRILPLHVQSVHVACPFLSKSVSLNNIPSLS